MNQRTLTSIFFCIANTGAFITGVDLLAGSFYLRQTVTTLLPQIPLVIFHYQSCSPTEEGQEVAGWYAEELPWWNRFVESFGIGWGDQGIQGCVWQWGRCRSSGSTAELILGA